MKHTPGKWEVGKVIDNNVEPIHHRVMGNDGVKIVAKCYYGTSNNEREANANLIAAAPELLKALSMMVRATNVKEVDPLVMFATIEKAKDAISKAEGK